MVWEECRLCVERQNRKMASEATLLHAATSTTVAAFGKDGGKSAFKQFKSLLTRLSGETNPARPKKNMADLVKRGR